MAFTYENVLARNFKTWVFEPGLRYRIELTNDTRVEGRFRATFFLPFPHPPWAGVPSIHYFDEVNCFPENRAVQTFALVNNINFPYQIRTPLVQLNNVPDVVPAGDPIPIAGPPQSVENFEIERTWQFPDPLNEESIGAARDALNYRIPPELVDNVMANLHQERFYGPLRRLGGSRKMKKRQSLKKKMKEKKKKRQNQKNVKMDAAAPLRRKCPT